MSVDSRLQEMCRCYLSRLRYRARKHGLLGWVNATIRANKRRECEGTQQEVEMLARMVDEERMKREEIPPLLGKTYRDCFDDDDFSRIKKLHNVGNYSRVDAEIYKESIKHKKKK